MTLEQRVRLAIGDLVIQLHAAQGRIEELEQQLKDADGKLPLSRPRDLHEVKKNEPA